ncbi:unnamed protein product [Soboliphyme baturini]|uniref:Neur_chan_LBD domain-containing protein n=1 Tax=Soboliphyme baturini TaxID=241478 RepID=A0A183IWW5_9BILA|nr:unnamed protein product [Soboliphyme baturini]
MYFHEFREPRNAYDFNAMVTPSLLNGIMRISLALNVIDPLHLATFNLDVTMRCWKPTDPPLEFLTRHLLDRRRQVINITIPRDCYKTYDFIFLKADVFETDVQMFTQVTVVPLLLLDSKFSTPDSTTDPPQDYLIPIVRPNIPKQMYQGKLCKKCAP